jgi:2-keto-4-pentenoate hydratase
MTLSLTNDQIDDAADALVAARVSNTMIDGLPLTARPKSLADAYAIQDRFIEKLGWEVGGWFCACTNVEIQKMLGLYEPYYARLLKKLILPSPATIRSHELPPIVLECEFAFTLSKDLPSRAEPYSREEVEAAIWSVHPSIEVVAGHLRNWQKESVFSVIADNGTDGALVYGEPVINWRDYDLGSIRVTLHVNDSIVQRGTGSNVLGDPLNALVWLANARSGDGDGLKAGHIHNTGTATSMHPVQRGDVAIADFGAIGQVSLRIE